MPAQFLSRGYKRVVSNDVSEGTLVYFHPDFRTGNGEKVKNMRSGRRSLSRKLAPSENSHVAEDMKQARLSGIHSSQIHGIGGSIELESLGTAADHDLEMMQNARIRAALLASQQSQPDVASQLRALEREETLRRLAMERQLQVAQLRMDQLAEERLLMDRLLGAGSDSQSLNLTSDMAGLLRGSVLGGSSLGQSSLLPSGSSNLRDSLFLRNDLPASLSLPSQPEPSNSELIQLLLLEEERRRRDEQRRMNG